MAEPNENPSSESTALDTRARNAALGAKRLGGSGGDTDTADSEPQTGPWRAAWNSLPNTAKLAALGIVLVSAVGFGLLLSPESGDWKPISKDMAAEDLRAAVSSLAEIGIPYKVEDGVLLVDSSFVHDARLELAGSALPSGRTVGFELFDESELGRSAFAEKVNFHRALEGELARTISHISPIESARVHLVMPEDKLFKDQEVNPSASVHLKLHTGETVSPKQVNAIRHLVAGAVEKLSPGMVTIVDEAGAMIGGPQDPELEAADGVFEHQRKYERQLEGKIVDLLEPVVGVGGVKAKVSARIDYSHVVETEDRVNPEEQSVVSEQAREEQRTAADPAAVGIPGMASNTPDKNPPGAAESNKQISNKTETTTNYQSSRSSKRTDQPRGRTEQVTVAVIVDNVRVPAEDGSMQVVPRTEEELTRYKSLVTNAIGLNEGRGDTIEVVAETILRPSADNSGAGTVTEEGVNWTLFGAAGAGVLVLLGAIFGVVRARKKAKLREGAWAKERNDLIRRIEAPPSTIEAPALPTSTHQVEVLRLRAMESGHDDMRRVATVVRSWLNEDTKRVGA